MDFFLNGAEHPLNSVISVNSVNLINHQSMNWAQFKDPVSHMGIAGTTVSSWNVQALLMTNSFATKFADFSETFRKNSKM